MFEPIIPIVKSDLTKEEQNKYEIIGANAIKQGLLAVCTMAGGQGSRLGHNGPKGTFVVPFISQKPRSIFEISAEKITKCHEIYGVYPFWYIMTSKDNDSITRKYFEDNNYFDIPPKRVVFFVQGELPLTTEEGIEILDKSGNKVMAANGNGGIFKALEDEGILNHMQSNGINYICTCNVDNILVNPIDAISFGIVIDKNAEICIKSIEKANSEEKVGTVLLKDGKITVVEYIDMPKELKEAKNDQGALLYSESHFGCNYISLALLKRIADEKLPIHEAHKINDEYGQYIKREMFIFDGFEKAQSSVVIRVNREDEFAPIKNKEGVDSPQTAIILYENKYKY